MDQGASGNGESILPALLGKEFKRNQPILWENHVTNHSDTWPQLAVIKDNRRLAMTKDSSRVELHDIFKDWGEREDLVTKYPEVVDELKRIALDYNKSLPPIDKFDRHLCVPGKKIVE